MFWSFISAIENTVEHFKNQKELLGSPKVAPKWCSNVKDA